MSNQTEILLLGIAQDGGMPQIACRCKNCLSVHRNENSQKFATSSAIIDRTTNQVWLIDCSPDFRAQYKILENFFGSSTNFRLEGIFLTHLHMGHYVGLYQFGRETMNWKAMKIYGTKSVCDFFRKNQPWSTYVELNNFSLNEFPVNEEMSLTSLISIRSELVPHRAEFSDTVAYFVRGQERTIFYCPDVDSWERHWPNEQNHFPIDIIKSVDRAFIDATFFSSDELPGRKIEEIPHPTVLESFRYFQGFEEKLILIHLNHSNPLFDQESSARKQCDQLNVEIAVQGKSYAI